MTETMIPPKKTKPTDTNRISIKWILFKEPVDFPGVQESNINCIAEPTAHGRSYTGALVKDEAAFEIKCYEAGTIGKSLMIPRENVRRYEKAE